MKKKKKELLTLNKPIYVGFTVLELSKLEMYKFHNGFMKDNVRTFKFAIKILARLSIFKDLVLIHYKLLL